MRVVGTVVSHSSNLGNKVEGGRLMQVTPAQEEELWATRRGKRVLHGQMRFWQRLGVGRLGEFFWFSTPPPFS